MLYKYFPTERVNVLQNLAIRFSPLASLNDPYESLPLVEFHEKKAILAEFEEELRQHVEENPDSPELHGKDVEETIKGLVSELGEEFSESVHGEELLEKLTDRFCVLSLSRSKDNLLMWSHYASEGKGYMISFYDDHDFFHERSASGEILGPIPVVYSKTRPVVKSNEEKIHEKLFSRKPLDWAYEEEERLFRVYRFDSDVFGVDSYGKDVRLSSLPKDVISGIYIGYNASDDTVTDLLEAVKNNKLECPVYKASLHPKEYRILFDEIT